MAIVDNMKRRGCVGCGCGRCDCEREEEEGERNKRVKIRKGHPNADPGFVVVNSCTNPCREEFVAPRSDKNVHPSYVSSKTARTIGYETSLYVLTLR